MDSNSGQVMSAQDILQLLETSGALDKLLQNGFNITMVQAASPIPTVQPSNPTVQSGILVNIVY